MDSSTRVVVNTGIQYVRTVVQVAIMLYTSRVVLDNLGVEDYGIYNLVGGVIAMLSFIQINLANTTIRYLSYHHGKNDMPMVIKIFNNSLCIQLFFGLVICVLLVCATDFVFANMLNISMERLSVAKVVYYLMIGSLFFNLVSTPYFASLISHENLVYSSMVQIVDSILKVPIVVSLIYVTFDKLIWYSCGSLFLVIFNFILYYIYCRKKYEECRHFNFRTFEYSLFKEMFSFMGWNVYGTCCIVGRGQGVAILLNNFYSAAINAAYGIGNQVAGQLNFLSNALTTAINPQIIKAEGAGDRQKMFRLAEISCKFSFLLMSMISVPAFIFMDKLLAIWLREVPDYTTMFCRMFLLAIQIDLLTMNMAVANQAVGNVKVYSICINTIKILTLPIVYIILKMGYSAEMVMLVYVLFESICAVGRILFLHININLSIMQYLRNVCFGGIPVFILNALICFYISRYFINWLFLLIFLSAVQTLFFAFLFGLGEGYPLAPETADGNHYFQAIFSDIVHIARQCCMLNDGIDNDIVTVDFLEGYFPFTVAFLSIVGYLRKQRCTVLETQFTGVFDGFGKLVVPICQQVLCNLFGSGEQKKRYTTQFRVPISISAIFFSGESFGADV